MILVVVCVTLVFTFSTPLSCTSTRCFLMPREDAKFWVIELHWEQLSRKARPRWYLPLLSNISTKAVPRITCEGDCAWKVTNEVDDFDGLEVSCSRVCCSKSERLWCNLLHLRQGTFWLSMVRWQTVVTNWCSFYELVPILSWHVVKLFARVKHVPPWA